MAKRQRSQEYDGQLSLEVLWAAAGAAVGRNLDTHGEVGLAAIARLLGTGEDNARTALADLAFDEPSSDRIGPGCLDRRPLGAAVPA